jgi:hypothetical protein
MKSWKVPANLYDEKAYFEIDNQIKALADGGEVRLADRWAENISGAIKLARRGLEAAIIRAQSETEDDLGPMIDRWDSLADAAGKAHKSTRKLMWALTGDEPKNYVYLVRGLRTAKVFTGSPAERQDASIYAAKAFFQLADLMGQIADAAKLQRHKLAGPRQNGGDPAGRIFAETLAEAWIALTNRPPSSHENEDANPYLRFLIAAWTDAGGTVDDSSGSAGTAFKRIADAARRSFGSGRIEEIQQLGLDAIDWK